MSSASSHDALTPDQMAALLREKDDALGAVSRELAEAKRQLDWFKRQLFGRKSE
jgi:hypothetical protein